MKPRLSHLKRPYRRSAWRDLTAIEQPTTDKLLSRRLGDLAGTVVNRVKDLIPYRPGVILGTLCVMELFDDRDDAGRQLA